MKLPAWIVQGAKPQLEDPHFVQDGEGNEHFVNDEGLTFYEWFTAAGYSQDYFHSLLPNAREALREAWTRNEDPSDHRADNQKATRGFKMDDDLDGLRKRRR